MQDATFDPTTNADTVVGATVKIQGDLNSDGNISIQGQVKGTVNTKQGVYVSDGAIITANVTAGTAVVAGQVQGNIQVSGQLVLQSTARITGDISCSVLRVEDGALFTGKCSMGDSQKQSSKNHQSEKSSEDLSE